MFVGERVKLEMRFRGSLVILPCGVSHACGLTQTGILIFKGSNSSGQLDVPSHLPFEFEGIAMGSNHSCAIQSKNGLVLCWRGGSRERRRRKEKKTAGKSASLDEVK